MAKKQYKKNIFGLALEFVLKGKCLEQKEFGLNIGINQSNISGYVTGRTSPTLKRMHQIVEALGYDLIAFLQIGRDIERGKTMTESLPQETQTFHAAHEDIKGLLAKQIEVTKEHSSAMKEVVAEALAAAIKHVRDEEHEKALKRRDAYIERLQKENSQMQAIIEGSLLQLVPNKCDGEKVA